MMRMMMVMMMMMMMMVMMIEKDDGGALHLQWPSCRPQRHESRPGCQLQGWVAEQASETLLLLLLLPQQRETWCCVSWRSVKSPFRR